MPYSIDKKLVVAVSSSAVFDMTEADKVFKTQGNEAYRQYQVERVDNPFAPVSPFLSSNACSG